jgi:hypothetical protein
MAAAGAGSAGFQKSSLRAFPTVMELSKSLGGYVLEHARAAIAARGRFMIAVSGGSAIEVRGRRPPPQL